VTEYRAGGISELMEEMRPSCIEITATTYGGSGANATHMSAPSDIVWAAWRKVSSPFKKTQDSPINLSQGNHPKVASGDVEAESAIPPTQTLLLLSGLHRSQDEIFLTQDDVEKIETDRQLFCFMREQLERRYNRLQRFLSTTRVKDIHFSKVSAQRCYYTV
jgi:hypothetical protein